MNRGTNAAGERAKMRCPVCRKAFSFPVARVDQLADCPSCGERIRLLDLRVDEEPAPAKPATSATAMRPKPKPINWTWVGIGALGLIGIAVTVWALFLVPRDDPDDASATPPPQNIGRESDGTALIETDPAIDSDKPKSDLATTEEKMPTTTGREWDSMTLEERIAVANIVIQESDLSIDLDVSPEEVVVACGQEPLLDPNEKVWSALQVVATILHFQPIASVEFQTSTDSKLFYNGKRRFVFIEWECQGPMNMSIYSAESGRIAYANVIAVSEFGSRHLWMDPGAYYMEINSVAGAGKVTIHRSEPKEDE